MASFRKRGEKWFCEIKKGGVRTRKTFAKKYDAQRWAAETERAIETGEYHKAKRLNITVGQACDKYIDTVTVIKKGALKERQKFNVIKRFDWLVKLNMGNVEGHHIAAFRDERLKKVSAATVNRDLNLLGHVFSVAIKDWSLPISNPVQAVRRPKVPSGAARDRRVSVDEVNTLLAVCGDDNNIYLKPLVCIAIETGMRRGELVNLMWDDIDIKKRSITVNDSKTGVGRVVPMSSAAVNIFNELPHHISGIVFPFPSANSVSMSFGRACKRAGIVDLRFHDLRHEATSRFFEKGLNVMQVQSITGHKSMQMLKRYTHLKAEDLAKLLG